MMSARGVKGALAGQARSSARCVMRRSSRCGGGSLLSPSAASGVTDTSSAGKRPAGVTRQASSRSRVRCPAHSVCVPLQCGMSVINSQLQLAPRATEPSNPGTSKGRALARGAPKCRGCGPAKSSCSAMSSGRARSMSSSRPSTLTRACT